MKKVTKLEKSIEEQIARYGEKLLFSRSRIQPRQCRGRRLFKLFILAFHMEIVHQE